MMSLSSSGSIVEGVALGDAAMRPVSNRESGSPEIVIAVENVSQVFGSHSGEPFVAVDNISFEVPKGQFVAIVGASGCGKTTVLNMMAGLVAPTRGRVLLQNREVVGPSRNMGYMFARDALLPWRSARANVEFGLELRGVPAAVRRLRSNELLELVGLSKFENAYPSQLSQGMRQRVALARTMAIEPDILLLDEAFAALDAQTKLQLEAEFERIWQSTHKTAVLVTHDLDEAVALADRIIVFGRNPGRIVLDRVTNLPRPRDVESIRYTPEFQKIAREIWELLRT